MTDNENNSSIPTPDPQTQEQTPEQTTLPESSSRAVTKVSEYVISWKWLVGGLLCFFVLAGLLGATYYYRFTNLSRDILEIARKMKDDAEKAALDKNFTSSYSLKQDAANLLMDFNRKQPRNVKVLQELNELLEGLLADEANAFGVRQRRLGQIKKNCTDLISAMASDKNSFEYRVRIMEIEWELKNLDEVISRAREVLKIDEELNKKENAEALRYITLATLQLLSNTEYHVLQTQFKLPPFMDELLDKVYRSDPKNLEIAYSYARFIVNALRREEYRKCASVDLTSISDEERSRWAMSILDDCVNKNQNDVKAYLLRYEFKSQYLPRREVLEALDPDLEAVLKLDPGNADGLIRSGMETFQYSLFARRNGDLEKAEEKKKQAEQYLVKAIENNPNNDRSYQFLGEFYQADGKADQAIATWSEGVTKNLPLASPELVGRLVVAQTDQRQFEEAGKSLALLPRYIQEIRQAAPPEHLRVVQAMTQLLTARLSYHEGREAVVRADRAQSAGNKEEAKRLFALSQQKLSYATQIFEEQLKTFGASAHDYVPVLGERSIYSRLVGESLLLIGRLMSEQAKWSQAVPYFQEAMNFPIIRQQATIQAAEAYRNMNQPNEAIRLLSDAVERAPDNIPLRYLYMQTLFSTQVSRSNVTLDDLQAVQEQLDYLSQHADKLSTPWTIDFRMIHLEMTREDLSNDPDRILKAQQTAVRKYRELENKELPAPEGQPKKTYSDDLRFLAELASIYSKLVQLSDFDRVLMKMRELPNGEMAYFSERVRDALNRKDKQGAMLIIEEALESDELSVAQKQRFVSMMQNLKEDDPNTLEKLYSRLKTTFDESPDSLKPQSFFIFAGMALDRDDLEYAKALEDRLEKLEGTENGTRWRYIRAGRLLKEKDPPYETIRQLQEEIVKLDPNWDLAHLLKANIEEKYLIGKENDPVIKNEIIASLQAAIHCGNMQPYVWNKLLALYEETGSEEEARKLRRDAVIRGVTLEVTTGQFPQPYQRMYVQVHEAILDDPQQADVIARQCVLLAEGRRENPDLIFRLNIEFGKLFLDAGLTDSAVRHLQEVAKRGGTYVYPLAVTLAKAKLVDEAYTLILNELDRMPSSVGTLVPSIMILLSQVRPSEAVFQRIDKLMNRIGNGEQTVLSGTIEAPSDDNYVPLNNRCIRSMSIRFPGSSEMPDPNTLIVFPSEENYSAPLPETRTTAPVPDSQPVPAGQ